GIGADAAIAEARPRAGLIAGALTAAVDLAPDGELHWRSWGGIGLAAVQGPVEPLFAQLMTSFGASGLRARRFPDAAAMRWSKLVGNLVANSLSAILDLDAAAVYDDRGLYRLELRQLREALAVMRCLGLRPVRLPGANVAALALLLALPDAITRPILRRVVAGARGGKSPSLRRHVHERGGPSEAPWLNGAVVAAGARCGVPTPVNARLAELVEAVASDPERRAWFRGRADRLLEAMTAGEGVGPAR
ncbi:MAG TPA: ketopantoate reductase C-terminal domain-containing protein, partial [Candidatus Limnocylindrales bacterium]|nr:ketopantoate reductase C-terminal domain-containing protein [Candidatus Limnocylindrales bacterium]